MCSVCRAASSRVSLPCVLFRRIERDASVPASGVKASEFASLLPRSCKSSVLLRSVASEYGTSPRNVLGSTFLTLRRAAAAKKRRRIAGRLAHSADQLARARVMMAGRVPSGDGKVPRSPVSRRLQ